jgi:hypothetical protein
MTFADKVRRAIVVAAVLSFAGCAGAAIYWGPF